MPDQIISIEPANPLDVKPEELTSFVEELQAALPDYRVEGLAGEAMPRERRGVTWWEVVNVWLPDAGSGYVLGKVLDAALGWAKARFREKKGRRPKCVVVRGPDGAELDSMVLRSPRHKPVTTEEATKPAPVRTRKKNRKKAKTAKRARRKPGKKRGE